MINKTTLLLVLLGWNFYGMSQATTFNYTGGVQTYLVPAGVTELQIEAYGAQGGGAVGGFGGYATGVVPVTPGATLEVYVGGTPTTQMGPGGYNGGGSITALPCGGPSDGWPGGGASDVRTTSSLNDRIIVAGGGGGQGWSTGLGGAGGGTIGGDGAASWIAGTQGLGGTQSAGGAGGPYGGGPNSPSPSGTFGVGGNGGPTSGYCTGGGGGGGWYGGGGGYVSAGGGGSSYVSFPGTTNGSTTAGVNTGNGYVVITVLCQALSVSVSNNQVCEGEQVTLTATSQNSGTITWDNGVTNGVPFLPAQTGLNTYVATSSNSNDCAYTVNIWVNPNPAVNAGADIEVCNDGTTVTLNASGNASSYVWDNGISNGVPFIPSLGTTTYTLTGTNDTTGCYSTDLIDVTSYALPTVTGVVDQTVYLGSSTSTLFTVPAGAASYQWQANIGFGFQNLNDAGQYSGTTTNTLTVSNLSVLNNNNQAFRCVVANGICSDTSDTGILTVIDNVSIEELDVELISVFPNPVDDKITISIDKSLIGQSFNIIDETGKTVIIGTFKSTKNEFDLSELSLGVYFITTGPNLRQIKIIKK